MPATRPRTLTVAIRGRSLDGDPRVGVVIAAHGRTTGYWVTAWDDGIDVRHTWAREDGAASYDVVVHAGRPATCTCPARGVCRHRAASGKLIERGDLPAGV